MSSDWKKYKVSDLIANDILIIGDGYRAKNSELSMSGIPFARAGNINNGFQFKDADFFPTDQLGKVKEKISYPGDVVFTSKGTVGRFAYVKQGTQQFVYSPQLCFWRSLNSDKIHPRFIYYWMHSREFEAQVNAVKGQTDMADYVSLKDQRRMNISVPEIKEQIEIINVLSSIDDKIELNNAINKNLEEMAQSLFKRWFVDFEFPNENGEPYKSSGGEFEESELGLIPKGWSVGTATDIFNVQSGGTPKTGNAEYWNGDILFFTPKDCKDSFYVINTEKKTTGVGLSKCNSKLYKVGTVFITARGTVGKLSIAGREMAMNQSCYALVATKGFTQKYIFLQTQLLINVIKKNASGAVFDAITVSTFESLKVVLPSIELVAEFDKVVDGIFKCILKNINENQILLESRDTLLPKLMSGEVRVPTDPKYVQATNLPMVAERKEQYSTT